MRDGATSHRTKPVFSLLNKTFHERVLGLGYPSKYGCGFHWPPFFLILIHAIISCGGFWKIKCKDNNFRLLLT